MPPNGVSWLENLKRLSRYRCGLEIANGLTLIAWRCEGRAVDNFRVPESQSAPTATSIW
jgi:hypothetical protein